MSSATKTLDLLNYFSPARPEIGLSQLCRLANHDKATTHRYLQALETVGFVEQNPLTRQYRLGPAVLQLAQTREATVPRKDSVQAALSTLANATGETAHVSVLSGTKLYSLSSCESAKHTARAIIDITVFPLHATASGICAVAFGPVDLFDHATKSMKAITDFTPTSSEELTLKINTARKTGFACSNRSYEAEIQSVSVPIFDYTGLFAGAVSVACVATRFTPELEHKVHLSLIAASRDITHNWGGAVPSNIETVWDEAISRNQTLEPAK